LRSNKPRGGAGISYHGGPLILGSVHVYVIWYGNWAGNSATSIVSDFLNHEGGSPYYNINTTYYNGSGSRVSNAINYLGSTTDNYSQGTSLSDAQIQAVVSSAISSGRLPSDANGLYFVLTSADVTANSGFCTQYCGWHTSGTILNSDIKYAFVGNPDRCPTHPGALLREDMIPATGKTKAEIARLLGISRQHLYDILRERKPVSPAVAVRLGKLFGDGAGVWIRMQAAYDTWHAEREEDVSEIPTIGVKAA
jgi:addiction module HigA family antidote